MTENNLVFPGDQVSTSEELMPGDGTYEEDGVIKAAILGNYFIDKKNREARVKALTSTPVLVEKGDEVLAEVSSVRSSMVIADVTHVIGKKRDISGDTNGTLHVSEISKAYVESPNSEYALGDIIRAGVTQVVPSIQLTTKGKNHGVIKALCKKCRNPLVRKGKMLECENCGNREKRMTAKDYRNYDINSL
ncbi:MAG: exosome complex RNA-binding protein Csl4 [Candidatus Thermoplasmatota archaeon]